MDCLRVRVRATLFIIGMSMGTTLVAQDARADRTAAAASTAADVRHTVSTLADDSMRGRWTPSPELEQSAQFLAAQLRQLGLRPGGDAGTYLQRFKIDVLQHLPDSAAVWVTGHAPMRWTNGVDFVFSFNGWTNWDAQGPAVLLRGPLGAAATFDTTALNGRVLLIPEGWGLYWQRVERWHPAGVVWLADVPAAVLGRIVAGQSRPTRVNPGGNPFPIFLMSYRSISPLLIAAGADTAGLKGPATAAALSAVPLGDAVFHVTYRVRHLAHTEPANVVAILDGSDPALRNEYVVYSAHYDHLGIGQPVNGDSVYNGADDNASGTAAVLAAAKAFSRLAMRPRRSVIFVLVSAEEFLGLGSRHFLEQPPVPTSAMVADLNADMVGRNWADTLVVLGRHDSDLGALADRAHAAHRELGLTAVDSSARPHEEKDLYHWSDHAAFIAQGIPFLYFYSGMHDDYHRPSDSVDKIDFEKLARTSQLMFYIGLEIANADHRPAWNADSYRRLVPRP
jgi:hypothetical protein